MRELSDWLTRNLPVEDNEAALVHGDFRLDNLIFHPTEVKVLFSWPPVSCFQTVLYLMPSGSRDCSSGLGAVYHWAAFGRLCVLPHAPLLASGHEHWLDGQLKRNRRWRLFPQEQNEHKQVAVVEFSFLSVSRSAKCAGIPSVRDLISIYCRCRGIPTALPQLNFHLALSIFKVAGIAQVCPKSCILLITKRLQETCTNSSFATNLLVFSFVRESTHATYWGMQVPLMQPSLASVWSPWLRLPCRLHTGCWQFHPRCCKWQKSTFLKTFL